MSKVYALAATAVLAAIIGGSAGYLFFAKSTDERLAQCSPGRTAGGAIGGPFELVNGAGQTVTEKDIMQKPSLVYFGYTFCPDVCPFDMSRNAEAVDQLRAEGKDVNLVFISVDPERDTPEIAAEFAEAHLEGAIGLSGTPEQVKAAAQAYRVYYKAQKDKDPDFYMVDHTNMTYLMLPGIGFADFFRGDNSAEEVAERSACLIDAAAG